MSAGPAAARSSPELEVVSRWTREPSYFAETVLGVRTLWERQRAILDAVRDNRRVAVPSCHESGKTFVASVCAVWWLLAHRPSKVVTTAPTNRQVKELLWAEIRARHAGMVDTLGGDPDLGAPNLTTWAIPGAPQWFATGFASTADKASENATRLHGYHSPHLLVILDEAGGIDRAIWMALEGLMTSGTAKVLAIGNPTSGSEFERVCRSRDWRVLRISAFDCPNLQPGAVPAPWGVTRKWVDEMRTRWGESSAVYQTKVLGLFPETSMDTLISLADVERAIARPSEPSSDRATIGCDVARFGSDETTIYVLRGPRIERVEAWGGQDTMRTAGAVLRIARESGLEIGDAQRIAIDDTGVGGGVVDRLHEQDWRVQAVNFGAAPYAMGNDERFVNRRTEIWWGLRDWIRGEASLGDLAGETQDILRSDLAAPKYEQKSDGRIALESKDKIRERIGRSPDHGDALALAVAARVPSRALGPNPPKVPAPRERAYTDRDPDYDERDRIRKDHRNPLAPLGMGNLKPPW